MLKDVGQESLPSVLQVVDRPCHCNTEEKRKKRLF